MAIAAYYDYTIKHQRTLITLRVRVMYVRISLYKILEIFPVPLLLIEEVVQYLYLFLCH
jgi:hypothetical protein